MKKNATAATAAPTNHLPAPGTTPDAHPLAAIFPMMDPAATAELTQDIKTNGLREPVMLYEGKILDGRNRFAACTAAKVKPLWEFFDPRRHGDPLAFVLSRNLKRRHLTPSQRAMIAAEALPLFEQAAKGRQKAAGAAKAGNLKHTTEAAALKATPAPKAPKTASVPGVTGAPTSKPEAPKKAGMKVEPIAPTKDGKIPGTSVSSFQTPKAKPLTAAEAPNKSRDAAGKALGVSGSMVGAAKKLQAAAPAKAAEVKAGKKSLAKASTEAALDKPEVQAALARIQEVAGKSLAEAAREQTRLKGAKEILAYAAETDDVMLRIRGLIDSGWTVAKAVKFKLQSIGRTHRVGDLLDRAAAGGGTFTLEIDGWVVEVKKAPAK